MHHLKRTVIASLCSVFISIVFFITSALANNPPDAGHSSLSAASQAPADGQSTITVTVTLQDSSGNPLSGDNVTFSDPNNSTAVFNPTSTTLNSSGQATFTLTSTNAQTDNISVDDTSSNVTLDNLGQVTFTSTTPTPTPASCTDSAPGSTPQITSAVANGSNQITLTWTDATDPVTFYLLAFGVASGQYIYGNPNIGGQGTTSYTVNSLAAGTTYYFTLRAVNGCNSGSFSNEMSGTTTGGAVAATTAPTDTTSDADTTTQTPTDTDAPSPSDTPAPSKNVHPAKTLVAGTSKTKLLEYILPFVIVAIAIGAFIFWKRHRAKRKTRGFSTRNDGDNNQPQ